MTTPADHIDRLLQAMGDRGASDLHLAVGSPPVYRINGAMHAIDAAPLDPEAVQAMLYALLSYAQQQRFEQEKELDFSYSIHGVSRFRGNALYQRGTMGAVFRAIPSNPPRLEDLGLPSVLNELADKPRGLVLVTGATGSGKSTTLAAMIHSINTRKSVHIVTIEDPIEFLHKNDRAVIRQRELGADTRSFHDALKHVLRQDPDVIMIGEMRDLETIALAMTAAETGHLVLATLHTTRAASTVDRIVDVFPAHQQGQIRTQLAGNIEGVVSQTLVASADGSRRYGAMEIMLGTPSIRNLIRESKSHQIQNILQTGAAAGMMTLEASLRQLVLAGKISVEEAQTKVSDIEAFRHLPGMDGGRGR